MIQRRLVAGLLAVGLAAVGLVGLAGCAPAHDDRADRAACEAFRSAVASWRAALDANDGPGTISAFTNLQADIPGAASSALRGYADDLVEGSRAFLSADDAVYAAGKDKALTAMAAAAAFCLSEVSPGVTVMR